MTDEPQPEGGGATERNLGVQPIAALMDERGVSAKDLVKASTEQVSHKMVQRARKGRRLNPHVMAKVQRAMNAATGEQFAMRALFNYVGAARRSQEAVDGAVDATVEETGSDT